MLEIPKHIAVIVDGNRRFAKKHGLKPWQGHEKGAEKLKQMIEWAQELNIKQLSFYTFSTENFKRDKLEKEFLFKLFIKYFNKIKDDPKLKDTKINFCGRLHMFPDNLQQSMKELAEKTKDNTKITINFCMAYGGRAEIVDACKKCQEITEESITNNLYIKDDVDLMIRTSGELRLSNFLLWQNAYAEFIFLKKCFPEIEKEDFLDTIKTYQNRDRRFGN